MSKLRFINVFFALLIWLSTSAFRPVQLGYSSDLDNPSFALKGSVVPAAPADFGKISPANGTTNLPPVNIVLQWSASSPGVTYQYCIRHNKAACPGPKWVTVGANTTATITSITPNHRFYWQVRAKDSSGAITYADGGTYWIFTTGANPGLPGYFEKLSPADYATDIPVDGQQLAWNASSGAVSYQYCYDTVNNNRCDRPWIDVGSALTATVNGLVFDMVYFWQVRAVNAAGRMEADYNTWWSFTTQIDTPYPFDKLTPSTGATSQPLNLSLEWSSSYGAGSYLYCIDGTDNDACDTSWVLNNASTTALPLGLNYGQTYYWQVKAANNQGETFANSGAWWNFTTINSMPTAFVKIGPLDGLIDQMLMPWLYWAPSDNADRYEYCIDTNPTCPGDAWTVVTPVATNTFLYLTDANLLTNTTYYWQIRAVNNVAGTVYANENTWWSFTTINDPPTSNDQDFSVTEDMPLNGTLVASSNYPPTFTLVNSALAGTLDLNPDGTFIYTPTSNYNGAGTFKFIVSDGHNPPTAAYTATIDVLPVNDPPEMLLIPDQEVMSGQLVTFTATTTDPDIPYGDVLAYAIFEPLPTGASFNTSTGQFIWFSDWSPLHQDPYTFTVVVSDAGNPPLSVQQVVTISVLPQMIYMPTITK